MMSTLLRNSSAAGPPTEQAGPLRPLLAVLLALSSAVLVSATVVIVVTGTVADGLPDPGLVVTVGAPLVRGIRILAAVSTVGALVLAVVLIGSGGSPMDARQRTLLRAASRWAVVWAVAAVCSVLLEVAQVLGVSLTQLWSDTGSAAVQAVGGQIRGLIFTAWAAGLCAYFCRGLQTRAGGWTALVVAVAALAPPVITGHSAHADLPATAVGSLLLHVLAVSVWMGVLVALVLHAHPEVRRDAAVLGRFSTLALVSYAAVASSGVVNVLSRLDWSDLLVATPYTFLLGAKLAGLLVLGWFGLQHRRRTLPAVAAGRPGAFGRLIAAEIVVMAVVLGLAVVLTMTSPGVSGVHA